MYETEAEKQSKRDRKVLAGAAIILVVYWLATHDVVAMIGKLLGG